MKRNSHKKNSHRSFEASGDAARAASSARGGCPHSASASLPRTWLLLLLVSLVPLVQTGCLGDFEQGDDRRDLAPGDSIHVTIKGHEGGELRWRVALIPQGTGAAVRVRLAEPNGRAIASGTVSDSLRVDERTRRVDVNGRYALTIRNLSPSAVATIQWSAGYEEDARLRARRMLRDAAGDAAFVLLWLVVTGLWLAGSLGAAVGGSTLGLRWATRMVPEERATAIPKHMLPERIMFDGVHAHNDFFFLPLLFSLLGGLVYFAAASVALRGVLRVAAWVGGWIGIGLVVAALCFGWALRESRRARI